MEKTVLIVEDEPEIREVIRMVVEELLGYDTVVAATGEEGLEKALETLPDIAVLDLLLPGMDGFTVASSIRADPQVRTMKLLALSALSREQSMARARQAGFDAVLIKPFDVDDLLEKIQEMVNGGASLLR